VASDPLTRHLPSDSNSTRLTDHAFHSHPSHNPLRLRMLCEHVSSIGPWITCVPSFDHLHPPILRTPSRRHHPTQVCSHQHAFAVPEQVRPRAAGWGLCFLVQAQSTPARHRHAPTTNSPKRSHTVSAGYRPVKSAPYLSNPANPPSPLGRVMMDETRG